MNADRVIRVAAAATVAGLAGIAAAISYSHMRLLAQVHGQAGWHGHAFPLSVDGIEIVASLVLLADRRAGRGSGWLPWAALAVGAAGSVAANVATAGPGTISRIIAGWPALALLIAVKLLSGLLDQHASSSPGVVSASTGQDRKARIPSASAAVPAQPHLRATARQWIPAARTREEAVGRRTGHAAGTEVGTARVLPVSGDLLSAARVARDALKRDGRHLTRDALAAHLRENGYPVSNSRLTLLLQALRGDRVAMPVARTDTAA